MFRSFSATNALSNWLHQRRGNVHCSVQIKLAKSNNLGMSPFKITRFNKPMKSIGQCAYPLIIAMTALLYNGHQLEPHLSVSGCIYHSAICIEFSSVILSYHSPAPSIELHRTLCHSFPFHYYKDERISVVGIYHIVGPAMPRPAPRLGTRSFQLQCVASTTHWGL